MVDVSDSIKVSAQEVFRNLLSGDFSGQSEEDHDIKLIAAAILAERERCAKIAEDFVERAGGYGSIQTNIAREIRKGEPNGV